MSKADIEREYAEADKRDGGPAFPWVTSAGSNVIMSKPGMSLRDYLAAQALAGLLANPTHDHLQPDQWAHDAYAIADAMLAERAK